MAGIPLPMPHPRAVRELSAVPQGPGQTQGDLRGASFLGEQNLQVVAALGSGPVSSCTSSGNSGGDSRWEHSMSTTQCLAEGLSRAGWEGLGPCILISFPWYGSQKNPACVLIKSGFIPASDACFEFWCQDSPFFEWVFIA